MIWPFKKRTKSPPPVGLTIGAQWVLRSEDGDPWGRKYHPAEILDVKEGWVRYKIGDIIFTDERMKQDMFVEIYRPLL